MPETLNMTRAAFVSAVKTKTCPGYFLNVVVVRLLTVALMVTHWRAKRSRSVGLVVPDGYRAWPVVESEADSDGVRRRLRFYVCPKAAAITDGETFPVGTVLVVETSMHKRSTERIHGLEEKTAWTESSVFVMGKYASMYAHGNVPGQRDGWGYATYDSDGVLLAADSTVCRVLRLPQM